MFNILSELEQLAYTQQKAGKGLFSLGKRRLLEEILLLSMSTCWEDVEKTESVSSPKFTKKELMSRSCNMGCFRTMLGKTFTIRVVEYWKKLHREVVESPFFEIFYQLSLSWA